MIDFAKELPQVLQHPRGNIAMYRALKQMRELIDAIVVDETMAGVDYDSLTDKINASLDDIDTMMDALK